MKWKDVSFILRGKKRKSILKNLDKPKTATKIAKELKIHRSAVSRILLELAEKGYVFCKDKKEPYDRHYEKTEKGERVLKEVERIE